MIPQPLTRIGLAILLLALPDWKAPAATTSPLQAASADKTLARLLLKRARLRTSGSDRNLEGAIHDAQEAIQHDSSLTVAHYVVCAKAHLMKARSARSDATQLREVTESIQNCADARGALRPEDIGSKVDVLLVRSAALVDRANDVRDVTFESQSRDLHQALADAQEAATLFKKVGQVADGRQPEEPDLALGNAYEDLAWIADEDAPANYGRAIEAFQNARRKEGLGGRAEVSVGRCYYRIGVQSGFEAKDYNSKAMLQALGIDASPEKARDLAEIELSGADPFDLGDAAQAEFYLADLLSAKSMFDAVDKHFDRLVACAGDESAKSLYCWYHACSYLGRWEYYQRQGNANKAAEAWEKATNLLVEQIEKCKARPMDDAFDSHKQSVFLVAEMKRLAGDLAGAAKDLDDELSAHAPNFTPGHASLLHLRGQLSLKQGAKAYNDDKNNTQASIDSYQAALGYFEKEIECVKLREALVAAHLFAASAAAIAYDISFWDPKRGVEAAERDYYAKAISHLKEVDRLWKRLPSKNYGWCYKQFGIMFADKLSGIKSNRPPGNNLSRDDAKLAITCAEYVAALNPGDQELAGKVDKQKKALSEYLR